MSDVDPFNPAAVEWAVATRVQPHRDIEIMSGLTGIFLGPLFAEGRTSGAGAHVEDSLIDATPLRRQGVFAPGVHCRRGM